MKILTPTPLMRDAAAVLEAVRDDLVVIGAVAVQVALAGHEVAVTPTRDVDAGVANDAVERVVAHLERQGMRRSEAAHERAFTWIKDELKIRLLRKFEPFPRGASRGLPVSNMLGELSVHRVLVAFTDEPERGRFWAASPAGLIGLKEAAFGRTRHSGEPVDRDFSDVALLIDRLGDEIVDEIRGPSPMRSRAIRAARRLCSEDEAIDAAARELARTSAYDTEREAALAVQRACRRLLQRLGVPADAGGDE